jgi:MFS family permease
MIEKNGGVDRRNFLLNIIEGALFIASGAFISAQTVLPALVARLGGGNVAVGVLSVIVWIGVFLPQIFAARYVETLPWKKPWAVGFGLMHRLVILLIGVVIFYFGDSQMTLALLLFFFLFALCQILMGFTTPGWFDLFAKVTPVNRRGRLVGIRNSIGGAAAFLCGLVLIWLLDTLRFPHSFALAFCFAFLLQIASLGFQSRLVEQEPSAVVARQPVFGYLRKLPDVISQNSGFRAFIATSMVTTIGAMPVGFFTVYALREFHADGSVVGEFTLTVVATQVISALVIGFLADRYGNKIALIIANSGMFCATLCALVAPTLLLFRAVYVFLGMYLGTEVMARYNISIEYGPVHLRSMYVGLMNTLLAPLYISGILAGWVSDLLGYKMVFGIGAVFSLVGVSLLVFWVRDPGALRHGSLSDSFGAPA